MPDLTITRPSAAQGLVWVRQGWELFKRTPVPWAGMTALVFLLLMGVAALPVVGGWVIHILSPFIVAGFLAASRAAQQGELVTFLYLGAGLRAGGDSLLRIGLIYMMANLLLFRLVAMVAGADLGAIMAQMEHPRQLSPDEASALLRDFFPILGLGTVVMVPLLMATWFSPALAHFEGFRPIRAMWWSLWVCAVNWRPMLVYSAILGLVGIAALLIPLGLGLLFFIPWTLTSTYAAYRDMFVTTGPGVDA